MEGEFPAPITEVDYPSTLDKHNPKGKSAVGVYMKLYNRRNKINEEQKTYARIFHVI